MKQTSIPTFGAKLLEPNIGGYVGTAWHVHLSHGLRYPIYGDGKVLGQTRHFVVADIRRLGGIGVPEHETILYPANVQGEQLSWGEETRFLSPGLDGGVRELMVILEAREKQREMWRKQTAEMRKMMTDGVKAQAKAQKNRIILGMVLAEMLRVDTEDIKQATKAPDES